MPASLIRCSVPFALGEALDPGPDAGAVRLWGDGGFAVGALLSEIVADAYGIPAAVGVVAGLTGLSGVFVAFRMRSSDHHLAAA